MLIKTDSSCLLVIDVQVKLNPTMVEADLVVSNTSVLLKSAMRLDVPILVSEQYKKGLGSTVPELSALIPKNNIVEKVSFSCMGETDYAKCFRDLGRNQAVLAGIEAHVCVLQTAEDLLAEGYQVFVVSDATSSRMTANHQAALQRMRDDGAHIVTTEMVVFEWLGKSGTPEFKELSPLIR